MAGGPHPGCPGCRGSRGPPAGPGPPARQCRPGAAGPPARTEPGRRAVSMDARDGMGGAARDQAWVGGPRRIVAGLVGRRGGLDLAGACHPAAHRARRGASWNAYSGRSGAGGCLDGVAGRRAVRVDGCGVERSARRQRVRRGAGPPAVGAGRTRYGAAPDGYARSSSGRAWHPGAGQHRSAPACDGHRRSCAARVRRRVRAVPQRDAARQRGVSGRRGADPPAAGGSGLRGDRPARARGDAAQHRGCRACRPNAALGHRGAVPLRRWWALSGPAHCRLDGGSPGRHHRRRARQAGCRLAVAGARRRVARDADGVGQQ